MHRTRRAWLLLLDTSASGTRISCEERRTERGVRGCSSWTHPLQGPEYPTKKRAWLFLQGQTATVIVPKGPTKAYILEIHIKSITTTPHS
ncbi:GL22389 [Drosophila persimilis]|uniref:GL22389 n=1 Tax=Drosophila persimilis TaxID=7234 RepID=B4HDF8_DROPE|nr:GL22389 [Drosophila persimilis]